MTSCRVICPRCPIPYLFNMIHPVPGIFPVEQILQSPCHPIFLSNRNSGLLHDLSQRLLHLTPPTPSTDLGQYQAELSLCLLTTDGRHAPCSRSMGCGVINGGDPAPGMCDDGRLPRQHLPVHGWYAKRTLKILVFLACGRLRGGHFRPVLDQLKMKI